MTSLESLFGRLFWEKAFISRHPTWPAPLNHSGEYSRCLLLHPNIVGGGFTKDVEGEELSRPRVSIRREFYELSSCNPSARVTTQLKKDCCLNMTKVHTEGFLLLRIVS